MADQQRQLEQNQQNNLENLEQEDLLILEESLPLMETSVRNESIVEGNQAN